MLLLNRDKSVLVFYLKESGTNNVYLIRNILTFDLDLDIQSHPINKNELSFSFTSKKALTSEIAVNTLNFICEKCYFKYNNKSYNLIGFISRLDINSIEYKFELSVIN